MKTCHKILLSFVLAPAMALLLLILLNSGLNHLIAKLILVHFLTIIDLRFLLKKECCHIRALYSGFALTVFACYVFEANTGSFFLTYVTTALYTLPALLFTIINIYLAKRESK